MPALALMFALALQQSNVATYADPKLNLQFDHAKTWTLNKPIRSRYRKPIDGASFTLPIDGTAHTATLEVVRTQFNAKPELWQDIQVQANQQMRHEVAQQWSQEILGIPTLFTRSVFKEGDLAMTSLSGLFYMRGPRKMLLRLNCETNDASKAQAQLMSVLETLRTIDGATPTPEDPNRKIDPDEAKSTIIATRPVSLSGTGPKLSPLTVGGELSIASRRYSIMAPKDCSVTVDGLNVVFAQPKDGLSVKAVASYTLDSDAPEAMLLQRANAGLETFDKVSVREDGGHTTPRGLKYVSVLRKGSDKNGSRITFDVSLSNKEIILLVGIVFTGEEKPDAKIAAIKKLLDNIDIVQAK